MPSLGCHDLLGKGTATEGRHEQVTIADEIRIDLHDGAHAVLTSNLAVVFLDPVGERIKCRWLELVKISDDVVVRVAFHRSRRLHRWDLGLAGLAKPQVPRQETTRLFVELVDVRNQLWRRVVGVRSADCDAPNGSGDAASAEGFEA